MKRNMIYLLLMVAALFTLGQTAAEAGVSNVGGTWVLSPAAWHPNPNKLHENYPFELSEKSTGDTDSADLFSTDKPQHLHDTHADY